MTQTKKFINRLLIIIICIFSISIIFINNLSNRYTVQAARVQLNSSSKTLIKGTTYTLKVKNTRKKVKWYTGNKKVATVSSKGKVTAVSKGTATIRAKVGSKNYYCKIKVETPSLNKTRLFITKGKTYNLKINGTKKKVKWSSSNKKIAKVDSKGKITAVNKGTTTIKAKIDSKTYSCKVTVEYRDLNKEIFSKYYKEANKKLKTMTLDEKISQMFLVRFPDKDETKILKQYKFGGYIFFAKDFKEKTEKQVKDKIQELQKISKIPILTAVDEEGGTVVRVSSNKNLAKEKFKSPMDLYKLGGFDKIKQDTIEKSKVLNNLGLNLNLAPVVDVSTNPKDYMYKRTLGKGTKLTATYAKTAINASKGTNVSYALKHFPGYGNNVDTHTGKSIDKRSYSSIVKNDLPPFTEGIRAGAEAVLVSHNIVTSIDKKNPASLSLEVHKLLRNELNFTGVIITDDLDMGAVSNDTDAAVKAIQAGNDLIITTDYKKSISSVKKAVKNKKISEKTINDSVVRILAWKYYKGLM
ncbi:MAG: hypothetical protein HFJ17_00705 [Clostridia bacterium]|nr:hypothetical protein [Clostridia bacterium]